METAALKLFDKLNQDLYQIEKNTDEVLIRYKESAQLTQSVIHQLLEISASYSFTDSNEEIKYYKEIKPKFCKLLYYYSRLYQLELERSGSKELFKEILRKELNVHQEYIRHNHSLYSYFKSGNSYLDNQLFVRGNTQIFPNSPDDAILFTDNKKTAACSFIIAKLLAGEMLQEYIENEIEVLSNPTGLHNRHEMQRAGVEWQATKTAIVELGYALYFSGAVSKKVEVVRVIESLALAFNISIDLSGIYKTYEQIRMRKKNPTQFIDSIQQGLILKINLDNENML